MNKNKFLLLLVPLVFLAISCNRQQSVPVNGQPVTEQPVTKQPITKPAQKGSTVTIAGHVLNVEVASTQDQQLQGLSGRVSMPQNSGMLFLFAVSHRYTFWMKDMKFPLDFIWIAGNEVLQIDANAPVEPAGIKDSNLKVYIPAKPVEKVLEVNAGWAERNNIKVGDTVDVSL